MPIACKSGSARSAHYLCFSMYNCSPCASLSGRGTSEQDSRRDADDQLESRGVQWQRNSDAKRLRSLCAPCIPRFSTFSKLGTVVVVGSELQFWKSIPYGQALGCEHRCCLNKRAIAVIFLCSIGAIKSSGYPQRHRSNVRAVSENEGRSNGAHSLKPVYKRS